jgi:cytochrome c biogenesis protein CcmG, thiol:disulfide interchange protein DsbE
VRRKVAPLVTALVAAALVGVLVYGLTARGTSRALDQALAAGRYPPAPNVRRALPVLDGLSAASSALARWRGGVVVVNFWASWCDTCVAEAPLLERAQRLLAARRAGTVVGITYTDVSGDSLASIRRFGFTFPNLRDVDGSYAAGYGTSQLPETFVLDRQLHVVAIARGGITKLSWLTGAIRKAEQA